MRRLLASLLTLALPLSSAHASILMQSTPASDFPNAITITQQAGQNVPQLRTSAVGNANTTSPAATGATPLVVNAGATGTLFLNPFSSGSLLLTKSTVTSAGAFVLAPDASLSLFGPTGTITTGSSVTASAFFGDGSQLTGGPWIKTGQVVALADPADNVVVQSTLTVQGGEFSVGGSTFSILGGRAGIGTTAPSADVEVRRSGANASYMAKTFGTGLSPSFLGRSARGTEAVPTPSQANDVLAFFGGSGHDGTDFAPAPSRVGVTLLAAENWTATAQGTSMSFRTTPLQSIVPATRMILTADGRVGIGTTGPAAKLQVSTTGVSGATNVVQVTTGAVAGSDVFVIKGDGRVGIGTTAPQFPLHVFGTIAANGNGVGAGFRAEVFGAGAGVLPSLAYRRARGTSAVPLRVEQFDNLGTIIASGHDGVQFPTALGGNAGIDLTAREAFTPTAKGTGIHFRVTPLGSTDTVRVIDIDGLMPLHVRTQSGAEVLTAHSNGNVGIGTSNPVQSLDVRGSILAQSSVTASAFFGDGSQLTGGPWNKTGQVVALADPANNAVVQSTLTVQGSEFSVGGSMLSVSGGNIGIGTSGPNARLQVEGGDAAVATQGNGLILRATDGANCFRVTTNNAGTLSTALVACP